MVGQCTNQVIADTLEVHVRQLHRLLQEQGTSYVKIKDRVRRQLAVLYLKQDALSLMQIASLLDYAEQSAFSRSCQRWFQMSPRNARRCFLLAGEEK